MDEQSARAVRKTYKYKLKPTPQQEQAMACVVRRCRELYNAALQERKEAWQKCGVSVTEAMQSAQLPAVKGARPEYRDIHSQRWSRPIEGTIKTATIRREADCWYVSFACADVPARPLLPHWTGNRDRPWPRSFRHAF